jgi:hypothetical protein
VLHLLLCTAQCIQQGALFVIGLAAFTERNKAIDRVPPAAQGTFLFKSPWIGVGPTMLFIVSASCSIASYIYGLSLIHGPLVGRVGAGIAVLFAGCIMYLYVSLTIAMRKLRLQRNRITRPSASS